ncbi:MAG: hypothetical protein JNK85_06975 [Verrucomicrobiales bacterium]|nr:hypothetical protein [Verrucomicrobiales bacterium]
MKPIGPSLPFRSDAGRGYITAGGTLVVPTENDEPGGICYIQFVAWSQHHGRTNYAILRRHWECGALVEYGQSEILRLKTARPEEPPARLIGLSSFWLMRPLSGWDLFWPGGVKRLNGVLEAEYLVGNPAGSFAFERSSDLTHWEDSQYFTNIPPWSFIISVVITNDPPAQFFRMRRLGCD